MVLNSTKPGAKSIPNSGPPIFYEPSQIVVTSVLRELAVFHDKVHSCLARMDEGGERDDWKEVANLLSCRALRYH